MVHALIKTLKEEPEEPALEVQTPANARLPKPRVALTPKPTPTPRRPKPKKPATPLFGVTTLPNTQEFDRILTSSEQQTLSCCFQRLKQQDNESTPRQPKKKKKTLGKERLTRGVRNSGWIFKTHIQSIKIKNNSVLFLVYAFYNLF